MSALPTQHQLMALPAEYLAEDTSPRLISTSIAFLVVTTVVFGLFIISRRFFVQSNGWETWTLYPLAYFGCATTSIIGILFVTMGGTGRHIAYWLIRDPNVPIIHLKLQTGVEFIYMFGIMAPKVCILLLYLQIFTDHKVRIATWVLIGVIVSYFISMGIIAWLLICHPFAYKWDKAIPGGHCANLQASYKYVSIPNIITDLIILILPISTIRRLHVRKWQKFGILVTFLMGGMGIITAIIRFVAFYTTVLEKDITYQATNTVIYTIIEQNAYFICSCLPCIRPLVVAVSKPVYKALDKWLLSWNMSSSPDRMSKHELSSGPDWRVSHVALISAGQGHKQQRPHDDGFIRLHETIDINSMSAQNAN